MEFQPLVSIIINNYNYDRFLAQAIDSATDHIVNDGSTAHSPDITQPYKDQIFAVFKNNGEQVYIYPYSPRLLASLNSPAPLK